MKLLMLRGQVPQDRDPQEIVFDKIEDCDDMWTQLFFNMVHEEDEGELWYWGGERKHKFSTNFTERWVKSFRNYRNDFKPDVIFCRGGFPEYHDILRLFPESIKIYYGAGRRYLPQPGFIDYDIILQDSIEQLSVSESKFPDSKSSLFVKPAADNIFYPIDCEKVFDVCFPANGTQTFKGHNFVYNTVPSDIKLLNLGLPSNIKFPNNVTSYRVKRPEMAKHISKCKVGIVAVSSEIDSTPRVIPEMLACNIPIVVLEDVRFWKEVYIKSNLTGELANKNNFWDVVRNVIDNVDKYIPGKYYKYNLDLEVASHYIRSLIKKGN